MVTTVRMSSGREVGSVFGFLKELVASAREGIDEAKQEFAEQQASADDRNRVEQEAYAASLATQVAAASAEERFAVALGAVYRETFLQELRAAGEQQRPPGYLLVPALPPDEVDSIDKLLRRDFDARDADSVVDAAAALEQQLGPDDEIAALLVTRACWLITAGTGVGLLDPDRMLELAQPFVRRAVRTYTSWSDFGQRFLAGERHAPGSNPIGRRALARTVDNLLSTPGSPWYDQPWPQRPDPAA